MITTPNETMNETGTDEPAIESVLVGDGDETSLVEFDAATGEVLRVHGAPDPEVVEDARGIADWLSPRLAAAEARLAGLQAEKAAHLARVAERYDADIKRAGRLVDWLKTMYRHPLQEFARQALAGGKARSLKVGLLTLAFRKKPARAVVTDETAAARWLWVHGAHDAVKMSVLVSRLPEDVRRDLECGRMAEGTGLEWQPESESFEVK